MRSACFRWISLLLLIGLLWPTRAIQAQGNSPELPVYVVRSGDTLTGIAARFGLTLDQLLAVNDLSDPNRLHPGDRLRIPGLEGIHGELHLVTVPLGANLTTLSWQSNLPEEALARLNHLLLPTQLYAGAEVLLPLPAEPPAYRSFILRPGETLLEAAVRQGVNPWVLVSHNRLPGQWAAIPNQPLKAPADQPPSQNVPWPEPVQAVEVTPLPLVQGHTTVLRVRTSAPLTLTGSLAGFQLHFFPWHTNEYVALQGVPAMAEPGLVQLQIEGITADGSRWTLNQAVRLASGQYGYESLHVDPALVEETISAQEMEQVRALMSTATPHRYWEGMFVPPSPYPDCFNSVFGTRRSYNDRPYNTYHSGVDFCGGKTVPIYAPAAGRVVFAGPLTVRGNATIIDHGWGVYTGYWHQMEIRVRAGEMVTPGQVIGLVGDTGRVTGAHLHWELWVGGVPVDPLDWLQQTYP